jgi:hypothetical protein
MASMDEAGHTSMSCSLTSPASRSQFGKNSWGYRAISFEMTTADGKKFVVSRAQEDFTKNAATTFLIAPGEHQVFAIKFDKWWDSHPSLPKADGLHVSRMAVYEVAFTPEATQQKVWTGRLESRTYDLTLRRW